MIVTLTPNPSLDRTVTLAGTLARGAVQRVVGVTQQSGGKGVNISRAAVSAGIETLAVLPAAEEDPFVRDLAQAGIACRPTTPAGEIRMNIAITEPDGTTTKLNSPGASAGPEVLDAMAQALLERSADASWIVLAGSLPPGAPTDWYARLVQVLRSSGARLAVDTSEEPLEALVAAFPEAAPDLMKPNGEELASLTGADPVQLEGDPTAAAAAAGVLISRGVDTVLVTLGGNGAVLVNADGAWHASAPPVEVVSTVGAGDSSLFGYLLGDEQRLSPPERLALAVAYGSAAAGLPGTTIPDPSQVHAEQVQVASLAVT